jgi:hypothetical protein
MTSGTLTTDPRGSDLSSATEPLREVTTVGPDLFFVVATAMWVAFGCGLAARPLLLDRAFGGCRSSP